MLQSRCHWWRVGQAAGLINGRTDVVNIPAHWARGGARVVTLLSLQSGQLARPGCCPERAREPNSENRSSRSSRPSCEPHTRFAYILSCNLTTALVAHGFHVCLWKKLALNMCPAACKARAPCPLGTSLGAHLLLAERWVTASLSKSFYRVTLMIVGGGRRLQGGVGEPRLRFSSWLAP